MFDETRRSLEKLGLPGGDLYNLPTSGKTFPDGAHFRMEVPTINSFEAFKALIDRATELGVTINRIDETYGIFRHTLGELRDYCALGKERGVAINLSVGPRAPYDTGATVQTPQGVRIAYRLRGMEQVVRAIEDVKRAVSVGCRGILVYDEGLLWVLSEMKKTGELPADLQFKVSAHCGHANPAAFKVLAGLGAHTINPVR
ncbi:peptidase, partial [Candidatus Bipolaricaulota bacterium]|nr:peptidase [Candidatus Bipolaricaulota bacterium]